MEHKPSEPQEDKKVSQSVKELPSGDEEAKGHGGGGDKAASGAQVENFQDRVTNILRKTKRTYTSSKFQKHEPCHPDSPRSKEEGDAAKSTSLGGPLAPITEKEKEAGTEKPQV